jgi:hypothetical protein
LNKNQWLCNMNCHQLWRRDWITNLLNHNKRAWKTHIRENKLSHAID